MNVVIDEGSALFTFDDLTKTKVSWLSRYLDEDERVLTCGCIPIIVNSVRVIESNTNYNETFKKLSMFDRMVNDTILSEGQVTEETIKSIHNLMLSEEAAFDGYITSLIQSYIRNKKSIAINIGLLSEISEHLIGFIFRDKVSKILTTSWDPKDLVHEDTITVTDALFVDAGQNAVKLPALYKTVNPSSLVHFQSAKLSNNFKRFV